MNTKNKKSFISSNPIVENEMATQERAKAVEGKIELYHEIIPLHQPMEDIDEISSTDDV